MAWKVEAKKLWGQKWWVLAFCVFCFVYSDHSVIHSTECYSSPCFEFPTLVVQGMSFVAPTGLLSANIMMPVNYVDRYTEGIYFRGGLIYNAATHAVVEDDLDPTETPVVTADDARSYLATTFIIHKFRILLSFPYWVWLYWLLFIHLRSYIKRRALYLTAVSLVLAFIFCLGSVLKFEVGGGKDVTWDYLLDRPSDPVDYQV